MTVVIADDEEMARFMLRSLLEESVTEEPVEVAAEARNGAELLAAVDRIRPDLAFVDIRMPEMGGLEAIRLGREKYPDTEWIILTSYAEFEYAREAIGLGALGYLLKPTRPEDLAETLARAAVAVEGRWRDRNASTLSALAISHFLSAEQTTLARSSRDRRWMGFLAAFDGPEGADCGAEAARLKADCEGRCARKGRGQVFLPTMSRNFLVAVDGTDLARTAARRASAGRPAVTTLSFESREFPELCARLSAWDRLLGLRLFFGTGRDYPASELESLPSSLSSLAEAASATAAALRAADYAEAMKRLDILKQEANSALDSGPLFDAGMAEAFSAYASLATGDEVAPGRESFEALRRFCESRLAAAGAHADIVAEAVGFVERHYMENIGVPTIAERLGISANYLSTIFHKRTGQKLVSFIASHRMLQAKRLLLENPAMPVGKVAVLVGHPNSRYFAQQFLRYVGCYPSQYRRMSR
jgi:two-component system, response regulator YesN